MKKILFASSALVAVAVAGNAQASEKIQLEVGGYMEPVSYTHLTLPTTPYV